MPEDILIRNVETGRALPYSIVRRLFARSQFINGRHARLYPTPEAAAELLSHTNLA